MADITVWGFDGSTYVRTVRMLLAEKGVTEYELVPVNVLDGEPKAEAHRARHPFGKVPVVDVDGMRILETSAICQYLNTTLPGPSLIPSEPKDRVRMDQAVSLIDSYGYGAMVEVFGYHLMPEFIGGKDDGRHKMGVETTTTLLRYLMGLKGADEGIAGQISVADFYLAPLMAYVSLTPHKDEFLAIEGMNAWWSTVTARNSFKGTAPNLG